MGHSGVLSNFFHKNKKDKWGHKKASVWSYPTAGCFSSIWKAEQATEDHEHVAVFNNDLHYFNQAWHLTQGNLSLLLPTPSQTVWEIKHTHTHKEGHTPTGLKLMVCCGLDQSQQKPVYSPPPRTSAARAQPAFLTQIPTMLKISPWHHVRRKKKKKPVKYLDPFQCKLYHGLKRWFLNQTFS